MSKLDRHPDAPFEAVREKLNAADRDGVSVITLDREELRELLWQARVGKRNREKLRAAIERYAAGEPLAKAFREVVGTFDRRSLRRKYDPKALAWRYIELTQYTPSGESITLGGAPAMSPKEAIARIQQEAGFRSELAAWKCLDAYRKRCQKVPALGDVNFIEALQFRDLRLPQKPS